MVQPVELAPRAIARTPVEVRFGMTQPQRRPTVLFRLVLVVPQALVLVFVSLGAQIVLVLGWFGALALGRLPKPFVRYLVGVVRWGARVQAYSFLLTDRYPPFSLDEDPSYPVDLTAAPGRVRRLAVLVRIVLVLPAYVVTIALVYGMLVASVIAWCTTLVTGRLPDTLFGAFAAVLRYQARFQGYLMMLTSVYPAALLGDVDAVRIGTTPSESGTVMPPEPTHVSPRPVSADEVPVACAPNPIGIGPASPEPSPPAPAPGWPAGPPDHLAAVWSPVIAPPTPAAVPMPPTEHLGPVRWPLVLTVAARWLTVVLLVLGGATFVTLQVWGNRALSAAVTSVVFPPQYTQVATAYTEAGEGSEVFQQSIRSCNAVTDPTSAVMLHCVRNAVAAWSATSQEYLTRLSDIDFAPSVGSEVANLETAIGNFVTTLDVLAEQPDVVAFNADIESSGFQREVDQINSDTVALLRALL